MAAFLLSELSEQIALDRSTEQCLHLTILESQCNGTTAKEIMDGYVMTNTIVIKRLDSAAATAVFLDPNVFSFLPYYKVSLLRSYVDAIATLNLALEIHFGVFERSGYKLTPQEKQTRDKVRSNAAAIYAMAFVLQEEFDEYFRSNRYNHEKIKEMEDRVKSIKAKALKGEGSLFKEKLE